MSEDEFVAVVTEGQPPVPPYFAFDSLRNRRLHPLLDDTAPRSIDARHNARSGGRRRGAARRARARGVRRRTPPRRRQHRARRAASPNGPATSSRPSATSCSSAIRRTRTRPRSGSAGSGMTGSSASSTTPRSLAAHPELHETSSRLSVGQLAELRRRDRDLQLIDVRSSSETAEGTLLGAREIPLVVLTSSLATLDRTKADRRVLRHWLPLAGRGERPSRSRVSRRVRSAGRLRRVGRRRTSGRGRGDAHLSVRSGRRATVRCGFARDGRRARDENRGVGSRQEERHGRPHLAVRRLPCRGERVGGAARCVAAVEGPRPGQGAGPGPCPPPPS